LVQRNLAQNTTSDRIEREAGGFHERVHQGFLELAKRYPDRVKVVNAMREPEAVAADIWTLMVQVIGNPESRIQNPE
jgi:dTMP kinase